MALVQIIEFRTSEFDEMQKVGNDWEAAAGTDSNGRRRVLRQDRDNPGRYFNLVFFDSFDDAMENSSLPVTQEFSQKLMALADAPPTFYEAESLREAKMLKGRLPPIPSAHLRQPLAGEVIEGDSVEGCIGELAASETDNQPVRPRVHRPGA